MSTISVIIPVYNTERYLRRCLDSIANQTYRDWEALCVNDGSTDGSRAILQEYADRDGRFTIIDKPNGGVSDARNVGMDAARGEYINFVDSDDLIHPQTFEIAHTLAKRDGSDIVTWYKDPYFRPALFVRKALGLPIDNALPRGLKRRFNMNNLGGYPTNDPLAHAVQGSGRGIAHPIKRFYPVMHLLRREVVKDVKFITHLRFEDFPWWSEVLLLNPRVTITQLPLYYYFPNFNSFDLGAKRSQKMESWIRGMELTWTLYHTKGTTYQQERWAKQLLWPIINGQIVGKMPTLRDAKGKDATREGLQRLWDLGAFATPPDGKSKRSQRFIARFIGQG